MQEPENDKNTEIECSGIASASTGMADGVPVLAPPVVKETWAYDSTKRNWACHSYNKFDGTTGAPMWDQRGYYERTMTFNEADQPTQEVIKRSEFVNNAWVESSTVETNEIRFDKRGNLWADGKRVFNYDAYNRLTGVWHRSTAPNAHIEDKGNPIAAFTYDGYGHRLTARYNSTKPETNQATLDDDPVDIYSYDHLWRVRTVTQATYHSSTSSWSSFVREQWFYRNSEDPTQYKIGSDAPVMRRIDVNGDGTFEETQNFVTDRQGSVVAVLGDAVPVDVNNESLGMKPGEVIAKVRYDTYGVPTICDPADIDRDGVVDIADVALYCVYWNAWHANSPTSTRYKEILDYNRDGVVDANDPCMSSNADYLAFTTRAGLVMTEVVPDVKDVVGNLPLYAGYWWDAQLEMYHVRHRVYRPEWGKWIQRDPLGYAAGWNLYEYVGGEPWRGVDPAGLFFAEIATGWANSTNSFVRAAGNALGTWAGFWQGAYEGANGFGRGVVQFGQQLYYIVTDLAHAADTTYEFRSELLKPFDRFGEWADGAKAGGGFFASTVTFGVFNIVTSLYQYSQDGDADNLSESMGQVAAGNILQAVILKLMPAKAPPREPPPNWPPDGGFTPEARVTTLRPGTPVDRIGPPSGRFMAPEGTPWPARSMPPGTDVPPTSYNIIRPIEGVRVGPARPWFGQPGGGIQFQLPRPLQWYIDNGYVTYHYNGCP